MPLSKAMPWKSIPLGTDTAVPQSVDRLKVLRQTYLCRGSGEISRKEAEDNVNTSDGV